MHLSPSAGQQAASGRCGAGRSLTWCTGTDGRPRDAGEPAALPGHRADRRKRGRPEPGHQVV